MDKYGDAIGPYIGWILFDVLGDGSNGGPAMFCCNHVDELEVMDNEAYLPVRASDEGSEDFYCEQCLWQKVMMKGRR